ncbi:MAG: cytochrome c1 [Alphaproteobacteria bacterium]|nr:cytochrome c1 [Alphaproteobacteria bacterium]
MRLSLPLGLFLTLAATAPALAATGDPAPPKDVHWTFESPIGHYDRAEVQRGFQVYKEVCSACHSLNRVAFHDLITTREDPTSGIGFSEAQAKAIAASYKVPAGPNDKGETLDDKGNPLTRPGILADHFPPPFPNEEAARTANSGALPPDLSLIVKAREGGPQYVYSIITGFHQTPPPGFKVMANKYYNPYFSGWNISMPPPLAAGQVAFSDGTKNDLDHEARAVVAFLTWASEPKMEERKRIGFGVLAFLILITVLLYFSYRRVWQGMH